MTRLDAAIHWALDRGRLEWRLSTNSRSSTAKTALNRLWHQNLMGEYCGVIALRRVPAKLCKFKLEHPLWRSPSGGASGKRQRLLLCGGQRLCAKVCVSERGPGEWSLARAVGCCPCSLACQLVACSAKGRSSTRAHEGVTRSCLWRHRISLQINCLPASALSASATTRARTATDMATVATGGGRAAVPLTRHLHPATRILGPVRSVRARLFGALRRLRQLLHRPSYPSER